MTAGLSALSPSASTIGIASASMAACRDTGKQVSTHCMPGPRGASKGQGRAAAAAAAEAQPSAKLWIAIA